MINLSNDHIEHLAQLLNAKLVDKKLVVDIRTITSSLNCLCMTRPIELVKTVELLIAVFEVDEVVVVLSRKDTLYHFIADFSAEKIREDAKNTPQHGQQKHWTEAGQNYTLLPGHEADRPCVCSTLPRFLDLPVTFTFCDE